MTRTRSHLYAAESNLVALEKLFAEPRVAALLGINHQDPVTGSTILHEAARNRDIDLVQWCLDRGADVLIRDRKGKLPAEVSKDERIKSLLKEG
ncbi:hypothetical protein BC937DRAFT_94600 [Endogone sp. FLAS-F59071]|nr:hypothetical protein BC937DRAFT_94600 [Endogone sp. FLAS-F59071]|eukprot:RUS13922.1 hypothetical protein BC937DRAFT_94600 [Endogone sp. FLAS-F59071]